jgi:hypothetical protein
VRLLCAAAVRLLVALDVVHRELRTKCGVSDAASAVAQAARRRRKTDVRASA